MANSENALTTTNAATPATTLEQRVIKIQFHLQNIANSAIIIGQELIECKKEVGHGNWTNWLKENFNLKERMARNFMQVAERFGNRHLNADLNQTQLIALLALPEGEEEKFIAEKAAEGKPVEKMTIKQEREEIKKYKAKIAQLEKENKTLQDRANYLADENNQFSNIAHNLRMENEALKDQEPQVIETVKTITPPDYVATVQRAEDLQQQVDQLLEQNEQAQKTIDDLQEQVLEAVSKQGEPPTDYLQLEKKLSETQTELLLAKLDAEHAKDILAVEKYIEQLFQAADALYCSSYFQEASKNYLKKHPNPIDKIAILRCICEQLNKACDLIYKKTK